jgi:hypothetical protein
MKKGYIKISKSEWVSLGGLTNSDLFTRQTSKGYKTYYHIKKV